MGKRSRGPTGDGRAGLTLFEIVTSSTVLAMILGTVALVFQAMTQGATTSELRLLCQREIDRGFVAMLEDLQTTDTIGTDVSGNAYFQIVDHGAAKANSVIFRKVESFSADADADTVTTIYGQPIQFYIDAEENLVREQNGVRRIVANRIIGASFAATDLGIVTVQITAHGGSGQQRQKITNQMQINPRNSRKL